MDMVRRIGLFTFIFSIISLGYSQKNNLYVGFSVGPNYVSYEYKNSKNIVIPDISLKPSLGYSIGAIVIYNVSESIGFSTGIRRISKGYTINISDVAHNHSDNFHNSNIEFPVGISVNRNLLKNLKWEMCVGATYDFLRRYPFMLSSGSDIYETVEQINVHNYSLYFKAGVFNTFKNSKRLSLDFSYHKEFIEIIHAKICKSDNAGNIIRQKDYYFKGSYFSLELGFYLPMGNRKRI